LASTGYIITNKPMAIGNETEPIFTAFKPVDRPEIVRPSNNPTAMPR